MTDASFGVQLERLVAIWTQIAQRFASKSEALLAFEVYNEPHLNMTVAWLNEMNAAVLPAIRATNPTRNVLFGGLQWMNPKWIVSSPDAMRFPSDDSHVFLEVHSYDPCVLLINLLRASPPPFSHESCAHCGGGEGLQPSPASSHPHRYSFCGMTSGHIEHEWAPADIDDWVDSLATWAEARQMAVLLGEFGCNRTQTNTSGRVAWYEHIREAVARKGMAATVWDDSGSFAIYDRAARTWDVDVLRALGLESGAVRPLAGNRSAAGFAADASRLPPLSWQPSILALGEAKGVAMGNPKGRPGEVDLVEDWML